MPNASSIADLVMAKGKSQSPDMGDAPPDEGMPPEGQDDSQAGLESCAQDLIHSIKMGDVSGVASALQSAFELREKGSHQEAGDQDKAFVSTGLPSYTFTIPSDGPYNVQLNYTFNTPSSLSVVVNQNGGPIYT